METEAILTCILSSTLASTVILSIKELILWKLNRKAKVEDDKDDKEDGIHKALKEQQKSIDKMSKNIDNLKDAVSTLQDQMSATVEHDKIILRDKIKYLISKYSEYGEITLDEKQAIQHMWNIYHFELGGNGDLDDWMDILDEILVKNGVAVTHYPHQKEEV